MVRDLYKNAHNYWKNYGVEVHALGRQIMGWWAEICPPGGVQNVHFGGSTGVSTVIVLMSWWCLLLKDKPSGEHTDCLRMLEDINQVLLVVIKDLKGIDQLLTTVMSDLQNHSTTSTIVLSPAIPPPQARKQASSEDMLSRKRMRAGKA